MLVAVAAAAGAGVVGGLQRDQHEGGLRRGGGELLDDLLGGGDAGMKRRACQWNAEIRACVPAHKATGFVVPWVRWRNHRPERPGGGGDDSRHDAAHVDRDHGRGRGGSRHHEDGALHRSAETRRRQLVRHPHSRGLRAPIPTRQAAARPPAADARPPTRPLRPPPARPIPVPLAARPASTAPALPVHAARRPALYGGPALASPAGVDPARRPRAAPPPPRSEGTTMRLL